MIFYMPKELEIVKLLHDIPDRGLSKGAIGVVVYVYRFLEPDGEPRFEIEFKDNVVVTLKAEQIEVIS
jgi:hypothetical protein